MAIREAEAHYNCGGATEFHSSGGKTFMFFSSNLLDNNLLFKLLIKPLWLKGKKQLFSVCE